MKDERIRALRAQIAGDIRALRSVWTALGRTEAPSSGEGIPPWAVAGLAGAIAGMWTAVRRRAGTRSTSRDR